MISGTTCSHWLKQSTRLWTGHSGGCCLWVNNWTWLRTGYSGGCCLWVNTAQNWPLWRLLSMSEQLNNEHGSELATLEAAVYEWTWLWSWTGHSLGCCLWVNTALNWPLWRLLSMSERGSELATLEAAVYEWTRLWTGHSGSVLRITA